MCRFLFLQHPGVLLRSHEGQDIHMTHFSELTGGVFCLNIPFSLLFPLQAVHMLVTAATDLQKDIVDGGRVS